MTKEEKIKAAELLGEKCGRRGFSADELAPKIANMSKNERVAFDRGLADGMKAKRAEATK